MPAIRTIWHGLLPLLLAAAFAVPAAAQGFYYRVQKGDTIDTVARRFRITAYDIARENRIRVNDRLVAGSQIWVPGSPAPRVPSSSSSSSHSRSVQVSSRSAPVAAPSQSATLPPGSVLTVRPGDSLWKLAEEHGTTVAALAAANGLSTRAGLQVGQKLRLPGGGEASAVESPFEAISPPPRPAPVSTPAPRTTSSSSQKSSSSTSTSKVSARGYSWPVEGTILRRFENGLTSKHVGLDIAVPEGTPVRAARDGVVIYAGDSISAYGQMVIIKHDNQYATCCAFNRRILVKVNDRVKRGQIIAESGEGRKGAEAYVHFQLRRNGEAIDPAPFLP
ncbi:MAG: hypothetical protein PWP23_1811 [Candidatus Sumerlaeota bacterium]|nr:hypothetical protein [Candidatus Sumerlaeota bacterium]